MSELCISAIIPNYNHAQLLPRAIASFLNQPVRPAEIIVMDDASTDNSLEVLDDLARQHPLLRVVRNERNLGVNANMNRGMELARGDYVIFTSADDELRPGVFAHAQKLLKAHPDAALCCGISEYRCTATGSSWLQGGAMPHEPCYLSPAEMVALAQRGRLAINNPNAVYKKSVLREAGGWRPELQWFADWFADCVVGFRHGMCFAPEILSNIYLYPNSYYNATARQVAARVAVMRVILDYLEAGEFDDIRPLLQRSGFMGSLGWPMFKLVLSERRHWGFLTPAYVRQVARRGAEITGRRFFPQWLARVCLRLFYGRR